MAMSTPDAHKAIERQVVALAGATRRDASGVVLRCACTARMARRLLRPREWHSLSAIVPDPRAKRIRIAYEPYS